MHNWRAKYINYTIRANEILIMLIPNSAKFVSGDMYVHNSCNIGMSGLPAIYLPMLQLICYIYLKSWKQLKPETYDC